MPIAMQSKEATDIPSTPLNPANTSDSPQRSPSPAQRFLHRLQERKYFDSGDYALCKASSGSSRSGTPLTMVGRLHPSPERIPRSNSGASIGNSPMKTHVISSESLLLLDDGDDGDDGGGCEEERGGGKDADLHDNESDRGMDNSRGEMEMLSSDQANCEKSHGKGAGLTK